MNNNFALEKPEITIIIPVYNEEAIIRQTLEKVLFFLKQDYNYVIIVGDDGSSDSTSRIVDDCAKNYGRIKLFSLKVNQGRGSVLTNVLKLCNTKYAVYFDSDLQIDLSLFPLVLSNLRSGYDLVIGSKHQIGAKVKYAFVRKIASKGYSILSRVILKCSVVDYQCGFKGFNVDSIKKLLPYIKQKGWSWDTEIVAKSYWAGLSIKELPAIISDVYARKSKVHIFRDIKRMGKGLIDIYLDKNSFHNNFFNLNTKR